MFHRNISAATVPAPRYVRYRYRNGCLMNSSLGSSAVMKTDKFLPTVNSPLSNPGPRGTRSKPRAFAVLLLAAVAFYFSSHSIVSLLPQARIESKRPAQLTLLHQACQQRFWRLKALPYCQRALETPWVDGGHDGEAAPLEVLQVYTPPKAEGRFRAPTPEGPAGLSYKECSQVLMEHTFGWSYDQPFVGELVSRAIVRFLLG